MGKRILVVDDDPDFRLVTGRALELAGYQVVTADSGKDAVEKISKEGAFDLFVVDAMMSTYTEGFELAHELRRREETRSAPILMLTAIENQFGGQFEPEKDAETLGLSGLLRKPVSSPNLLNKVRELIGA